MGLLEDKREARLYLTKRGVAADLLGAFTQPFEVALDAALLEGLCHFVNGWANGTGQFYPYGIQSRDLVEALLQADAWIDENVRRVVAEQGPDAEREERFICAGRLFGNGGLFAYAFPKIVAELRAREKP